jgi:hypothetical protein
MAQLRQVSWLQTDYTAYTALLDLCQAPVYAYPWYLNALGFTGSLLVLDDYKAAMPLWPRKKWGINYLPTPFFVQQWGLFAQTSITDEEIHLFSKYLSTKYRLIEYACADNTFCRQLMPGFNIEERVNYKLDLHLLSSKNYSEQTNRNLKKALKLGLTVSTDIRPAEIIQLYKENIGQKTRDIKQKDYRRLHSLMETLVKENRGRIIGVRNSSGMLTAASFFVTAADRWINLFPASNAEGRDTNAMTMIIDTIITANIGRPFVLDFEGSMIDSIARFYKGFGAKPQPYYRIKHINLPSLIKRFKAI